MNKNQIDDGGPAFARPGNEFRYGDESIDRYQPQDGMSLRDWFAGQALSGYMANYKHQTWEGNPKDYARIEAWRTDLDNQASTYCYRLADAMLRARETGR